MQAFVVFGDIRTNGNSLGVKLYPPPFFFVQLDRVK
jgi:hypothetical protein